MFVGFRVVEGTPAFGKASSFVGRRWNEGLGWLMRTVGASSPPVEEPTTRLRRGARGAQMRRGTLPTPYCGSRRCQGWSFARGDSARAVQRHRPTSIAASGGRVEAPPASGVAMGRWLPCRALRRIAAPLGRLGRTVAARGSRGSSSRGEECCSRKKERQKARADSMWTAKKRHVECAGIGCS